MIRLGTEAGFLFYGDFVWSKRGASARLPRRIRTYCSCRSPGIFRLHEYLVALAKESPWLDGKLHDCDVTPEEFELWTRSIWEIAPSRSRKTLHPASFPEELAERVIRLFTYRHDLVVDPFCGSGTTLCAAKRCNRRYVGFDNAREYVQLAEKQLARIANAPH